jgi:hypothetical protein
MEWESVLGRPVLLPEDGTDRGLDPLRFCQRREASHRLAVATHKELRKVPLDRLTEKSGQFGS